MNPTYNTAIRITSGLLPSTPGITACVEAGVLPFRHLIATTLGKRTIGFLEKTVGPSRGVHLLGEANQLLIEVANQELPPVARIHWCGAKDWNRERITIDNTFRKDFRAGANPLAVQATFFELINRKYSTYCIRYTDGSVGNDRVGIGITDDHSALSHRLPNQCSIFSAEALAIWIAVTTPSDRPIAVFTDSASVVTALGSETPSHPWIQAIILHAPPGTTIGWIPGHCGVPGNVEADRLASIGRRGKLYRKTIPGDDLRKWLTGTVWNAWSNEYMESREPFIRRLKDTVFRGKDQLDHRQQVVLSRLRSGHTRASHNMTGSGPFHLDCTTCNEHHSVEHFVCHCPQYNGPRQLYNISSSLKDALSDDPTRETALICFLKDSQLYDTI